MTDSTEQGRIGRTESRAAKRRRYPWYDSDWLTKYAQAMAAIRRVRPEALAAFVDAFRVFRTRPDFQVKQFERVFDEDALREIRGVVERLRPTELEIHEARTFGRFVVHNHAFITRLHERTIPLVSEAVREPVEMSYNFLSLYGTRGVCPPHMDAPNAKWTLDLCVSQSAPWPIHVSDVQPWPDTESEKWPDEDWVERITRSSSVRFTPYILQPGEAIVFSGSSQWHYREPIPSASGPRFSDMLFCHFIPSGTAELVLPENWARLFGIPELSDAVRQVAPSSSQ